MALYVYRVQNSEGCGPYMRFSGWSGSKYGDARGFWLNGHQDPKHPSPDDDGILMRHEFRCGFTSLAQLQAWFSADELRRLDKFGFRPVRVPAREVIEGRRQCAFVPAA